MIKIHKLDYFKALKASFLLIFLAMVVYRVFDQYTTKQIETMIKSRDGISSTIWVWGGFSLVVSIFFPTLVSIICLYALKNNSIRNVSAFFKAHFELSLLETLRSWGYTFLWGLLLIIPGLIKMSYYYLTTFVVLFSPDYAEGKVDALKKSEEISKKHWIKLNLIVTFFYVILPSITSVLFDESTVFNRYPARALFFTAFEAMMVLLFHYIVLKLFMSDFIPNEIISDEIKSSRNLSGELHATHV